MKFIRSKIGVTLEEWYKSYWGFFAHLRGWLFIHHIFTSIHCCARGFDLRCIYLISFQCLHGAFEAFMKFSSLRSWLQSANVSFATLVSASVLCCILIDVFHLLKKKTEWIRQNNSVLPAVTFQKMQKLETLQEHHIVATVWISVRLRFFLEKTVAGSQNMKLFCSESWRRWQSCQSQSSSVTDTLTWTMN